MFSFISNCCAIALTGSFCATSRACRTLPFTHSSFQPFFFYDFSITVNDEIRCIWKRKFSGATFLFLANRYVGLLYRLVTLFLLLSWSTKARGSADEVCLTSFLWASLLPPLSRCACTTTKRLLMPVLITKGSCTSIFRLSEVLGLILEVVYAGTLA